MTWQSIYRERLHPPSSFVHPFIVFIPSARLWLKWTIIRFERRPFFSPPALDDAVSSGKPEALRDTPSSLLLTPPPLSTPPSNYLTTTTQKLFDFLSDFRWQFFGRWQQNRRGRSGRHGRQQFGALHDDGGRGRMLRGQRIGSRFGWRKGRPPPRPPRPPSRTSSSSQQQQQQQWE